MNIRTERAKSEIFSSRSVKVRLRALAAALLALSSMGAFAGEVTIDYVKFEREGENSWRVSVTVRHTDTGWEHYADAWRVVAEDGSVLGTRTLYHPHVDEQPFTRSLRGIKIPPGAVWVYVEARDNVHGWSSDRVAVELHRAGDRFEAR